MVICIGGGELVVLRTVVDVLKELKLLLFVGDVVDDDDPLDTPRAGGIVNFILGVVTSPPTSAE